MRNNLSRTQLSNKKKTGTKVEKLTRRSVRITNSRSTLRNDQTLTLLLLVQEKLGAHLRSFPAPNKPQEENKKISHFPQGLAWRAAA